MIKIPNKKMQYFFLYHYCGPTEPKLPQWTNMTSGEGV